jgi:hypothetical protein
MTPTITQRPYHTQRAEAVLAGLAESTSPNNCPPPWQLLRLSAAPTAADLAAALNGWQQSMRLVVATEKPPTWRRI